MNLTKCRICNMALIEEEAEAHQCRKVVDFWIIDGIVWMHDGVQYYPQKLPTNQNSTTNYNNRRFNGTPFF